MSGKEALERIKEKIKEYSAEHEQNPTTVCIGRKIAHDLVALTEKEIGPVSQSLFTEGIEAVDKINCFPGIKITVADRFDDSIICK